MLDSQLEIMHIFIQKVLRTTSLLLAELCRIDGAAETTAWRECDVFPATEAPGNLVQNASDKPSKSICDRSILADRTYAHPRNYLQPWFS